MEKKKRPFVCVTCPILFFKHVLKLTRAEVVIVVEYDFTTDVYFCVHSTSLLRLVGLAGQQRDDEEMSERESLHGYIKINSHGFIQTHLFSLDICPYLSLQAEKGCKTGTKCY